MSSTEDDARKLEIGERVMKAAEEADIPAEEYLAILDYFETAYVLGLPRELYWDQRGDLPSLGAEGARILAERRNFKAPNGIQ